MKQSAGNLIDKALRRLGVLSEHGTASGARAELALQALNDMLDSWQAERTLLYASARTSNPLTLGTRDYTIGTGATFNQVRPLWIDYARVIPDTTLAASLQTEMPCDVLTLERWSRKVLKNYQSGYPTELYYDRGSDTNERGTIAVWPVPNQANISLILYVPTQLTEFADLTTKYQFSQGYPRALVYNLAVELASIYPRPGRDDNEIARIAVQSKALIQTVNLIVPVMRVPWGGARGGSGAYDIRSDREL